MARRLTDPAARAGLAVTAAGGAVLAAGWAGLGRATLLSEQIPWIVSGGLGGLALVAVGLQLFSAAGLAAERRRLDRVESAILSRRGSTGSEHPR